MDWLAAGQLWQYFMQYWKLSFAVRSLKAPIFREYIIPIHGRGPIIIL